MQQQKTQFVREGDGKWGVFGRNDDGSPFYVGPVYSRAAAVQLASVAEGAGYSVEIGGGFSKSEFLDAIDTS